MTLTYDESLAFLFPRTTTIKFGLDTTRLLLEALGSPHEVVPAVHVGGTNGKGSVSTLVAAALEEAGWRVGLYTSPHLVSFRERIRVDGVPITEDAVAMWTSRLQKLDPGAQGHLLRGHHGDRLGRLCGSGRGDRRGRGGPGRPSGQHERDPPPRERGYEDRARSHEVPGRHARADRTRKGRHRQARSAVRHRGAGSRPGGGPSSRGPEGHRESRSAVRCPISGSCLLPIPGPDRCASPGPTSGEMRVWRTVS